MACQNDTKLSLLSQTDASATLHTSLVKFCNHIQPHSGGGTMVVLQVGAHTVHVILHSNALFSFHYVFLVVLILVCMFSSLKSIKFWQPKDSTVGESCIQKYE